ncbi:MAG: hypothetical protein E6K56_07215, partial [Ignavibacteria bacterium]
TVTQFTINHPGAPNAFAFEGLQFLTTPSTGYYIRATDNLADGNVLTVNLISSTPHDGSSHTLVSGGAVVNWGINANPPPSLASVLPAVVRRGEKVDITLTGSNFIDTVTTVNIGAGIIVDSLTFTSASQIVAHASVMDSAAIGTRTVSVTNAPPGGGTAFLQNILTVGYPRARITRIIPDSVNRTQTVSLVLRGTKFSQALTTVSFGGNIAVNSKTVNSDTQMTVNATIGAIAAAGRRDVIVTNISPGGGSDTLKSGLLIASPSPTLTSITPPGATRGQTGNVLVTGLYYFTGTTTVSFGDSVLINSIAVNDFGHLTANMSIALGAAPGLRSVTVTNSPPGGGSTTVPNAFSVLRDSVPPTILNVSQLVNTGDTVNSYPVQASVADNIYLKSVYLVFSTNNFVSRDSVPMSHVSGTAYAADIPRQSLATTVRYFIAAYDFDNNRAASATLTFQVLPIPVFDPVSDKTVNEGAVLTFTVHANDANHDSVAYSASKLPAGARFTDSTFYWKPTYTQSGNYNVAFTADDHHDGASSIHVSIGVNEIDNPPVVQGAAYTTIFVGQPAEIPFSVSDPNSGQPLAITYVDQPAGSYVFDPAASTKFFRWKPTNADTGVYHPKFIADDSFVADTLVMTISVIQPPGPILQLLAPSFGHVGDSVKLRGFAFGTGTGTVLFSGTPAPADIFGDTCAVTRVPANAQSGDVQLISQGRVSNPKYFTVVPQPTVDLEAKSCSASLLLAADGASITLTSVILNHSGYNAQAYVTYFGGHPDSGGVALSTPQPFSVGANGQTTNSYVWSASPGLYRLYARVTGSTPPDPRPVNNTIDDGFILIVPLAGGEMLNISAPPIGEITINHTQNYDVTILNSGIDTTEVDSATVDSIAGFVPTSGLPFRIRPSEEKSFTFSITLPQKTVPGDYSPVFHFKTSTHNDYTGLTNFTAIEDSPKVTARLIDVETGLAVPGTLCFIDSVNLGLTDGNGEIKVPAQRGATVHFVGVKDGYLPTQTDITNRNDSKTVTVYMKPGQVVVAHVDVRQLTSQEVIDLGLDLNDPANFNYFSFSATIQFAVDQPPQPMNWVVSDSGHGGGGAAQVYSNRACGDSADPVVASGYDEIVSSGEHGPSCSIKSWQRTSSGKMCTETKALVPGDVVVIPQPCDTSSERDEYLPVTVDGLSCTRHVHYQCAAPDAPPSGGPGSGTTASGGSVTPAPNVSIPFVVAIDGNVRTLKQFFNVALAVANQADPSFLVNNLQATLSSDTVNNDGILSAALPVVKDAAPLPDLHGGQSASTAWVIRGDKIGLHVVKVTITGRLQPGDIPISTVQFATVVVTEPPQLDLVLHHPSSVHNGDHFTITAQVTNKSTTSIAQLAAVELSVTGTAELAPGTSARRWKHPCLLATERHGPQLQPLYRRLAVSEPGSLRHKP